MKTETLHYEPQHLDALSGILEEQIRQYESVLQTLARKRDILVTGQAQDLQTIDRELVSVSHKVAQLEKNRQQLQTTMGCPDWKLEKIIRHLPSPVSRHFSETRHRLLRALKDTERMNRENNDLLTLSMQWIQETLEIIAAAVTPEGASYTAQGNKHRPQNSPATPAPIQSTVNHSA
jgi:flagellar biosynthesis/type III secretory pathway chaperone